MMFSMMACPWVEPGALQYVLDGVLVTTAFGTICHFPALWESEKRFLENT